MTNKPRGLDCPLWAEEDENYKVYLKGIEDCIMCVCLDCKADASDCKHSDCKWCVEELGEYTEYCRHYEKGDKQ